jgi:P-type Ca2+ transporter type 2C
MITGDYAATAAAVAGQLGIDGTVLTGAEFAAMSEAEALAKVDGIGVIARVTPSTRSAWSTSSGRKARSSR